MPYIFHEELLSQDTFNLVDLSVDVVVLDRWGQISNVAVSYDGSRIDVASERHAQGNSTRVFDFKKWMIGGIDYSNGYPGMNWK